MATHNNTIATHKQFKTQMQNFNHDFKLLLRPVNSSKYFTRLRPWFWQVIVTRNNNIATRNMNNFDCFIARKIWKVKITLSQLSMRPSL